MKKYTHFFGVDVSKKTLDITYLKGEVFEHRKFTNDTSGGKEISNWLVSLNLSKEGILFCMETTGIYCFPLSNFLNKNDLDVWVEHATQIKKSFALSRGKNDKIDSKRIALYASKNLERIRLFKPMDSYIRNDKAPG